MASFTFTNHINKNSFVSFHSLAPFSLNKGFSVWTLLEEFWYSSENSFFQICQISRPEVLASNGIRHIGNNSLPVSCANSSSSCSNDRYNTRRLYIEKRNSGKSFYNVKSFYNINVSFPWCNTIARFLFQWSTLPDTPVHCGIEMSTCTVTVHLNS